MYKKRNLVNKSLIEDGQRVALKSFEMALGERELKRVSWSIPNTAMSNHPNKLNCKMVGAHSAFRSRCSFFSLLLLSACPYKNCVVVRIAAVWVLAAVDGRGHRELHDFCSEFELSVFFVYVRLVAFILLFVSIFRCCCSHWIWLTSSKCVRAWRYTQWLTYTVSQC